MNKNEIRNKILEIQAEIAEKARKNPGGRTKPAAINDIARMTEEEQQYIMENAADIMWFLGVSQVSQTVVDFALAGRLRNEEKYFPSLTDLDKEIYHLTPLYAKIKHNEPERFKVEYAHGEYKC